MKKIILFVLVVLFIVIGIFIGSKYYNYIILEKIGEAGIALRNEKNIYYEVESDSQEVTDYKIMIKDNNAVIEMKNENGVESEMYVDRQNSETLYVSENDKTYHVDNSIPSIAENNGILVNAPTIFSLAIQKVSDSDSEEFNKMLKNVKIEKEKYNDIECYKITYNSGDVTETTWFDVNTFLPTKSLRDKQEVEYTIKINSVKDADISIDLEGYELVEE